MDTMSFMVGFMSWPVLLYAILFGLMTVEVAYDSGMLALTTLAFGAALAVWMGWISTGWAVHHWDRALLIAAVYVPIGVLWAVIRWWVYVREQARHLHDRILNARANAKAYGRDPVREVTGIPRTSPQVREHKADITRWMAWWPFSFVATLLNDPFRRMFEALYRWLGTFLQKMSDRAFAHLQLPKDVENGGSS